MFKTVRKNDKKVNLVKICPDCGIELTSNNTMNLVLFDNAKSTVSANYCADCGAKRFIAATNTILDIRNKEEI